MTLLKNLRLKNIITSRLKTQSCWVVHLKLKENNMSGGRFEYRQYHMDDIAEQIEKEIEKSGQPLTKEELKEVFWRDSDWYEKYPEDKFHYKYPDEVIEQFKIAVDLIRRAGIYMHRIDWLLSGDDGDETFLERLKEDLSKLDEKDNNQSKCCTIN